MTDKQIIDETLRYLSDTSYNYAILIDGEWGCGKTYFVKNLLRKNIDEAEKKNATFRKVKYVSLYGCKNIQDIQENIVWGLADEVKRKISKRTTPWRSKLKKVTDHSNEISNNVLLTSKKIGSALLKKAAPDTNFFDIASDWLPMKSYIFIFDDIERCDCSLNEVFGFVNGLVEHESAKVIFVANEKEISYVESNGQKELQYMVVLDERIKWPEERNIYSVQKQDKISYELLEENRRKLFDDLEVDELYRKIREKLIGVTLHYTPDIKTIAKQMIESGDIDRELKEILRQQMDFFAAYMDEKKHHNLRTFQFFLSKISYLYKKYIEIEIDDRYRKDALVFLVNDCFKWSVRFKGNVAIPTDQWGKAYYEAEKKSVVIKSYVETGEYNADLFLSDIKQYVKDELENKLANDDPFSLLYNQYYFHEQKWCEEKLEDINQKLSENKYPLCVYSKIVVLFDTLVEIGFEKKYLEKMKQEMLNNIDSSVITGKVNDDLFYIDDKERKQRIASIIDELNLAIIKKDKKIKQKNIEQLLDDENWMEELQEYLESEVYVNSIDRAVFSKTTAKKWIEALERASVTQIDKFRRWLIQKYSSNLMGETIKTDLPIIKEIAIGINPDETRDLIKQINLQWTKEKMEEIVDYNM